MKKINIVFLGILLLLLNICLVNGVEVKIDNYYPMPAEAGDYFNVQLKVQNGDVNKVDTEVKFKPSYPFSLDPGEQGAFAITGLEAGGVVSQKFKIKVDAGAKEGENSLTFQYKDCSGCVWKEKSIPITVIEAQTSFDVVLQELNSEGVFIAIANIGKNPANAVTVRIPEQEDFKTQLVSASIVGNLESGDYTLVGFQIVPKNGVGQNTASASGAGLRSKGVNKNGATQEQSIPDELEDLLVQVDYTDPLGIRRSIIKNVQLNPSTLVKLSSSGTGTGAAGFSGRTSGTGTSIYSNTWFWVSIGLLVVLVIVNGRRAYRKLRKKRE